MFGERYLREDFPDMKGFSPRNLKYMRVFAEAWPDAEIVQQAVGRLLWYHQVALLDKLFGAAQLDLTIEDRFGNPVKSREWFRVPLHVIDEQEWK